MYIPPTFLLSSTTGIYPVVARLYSSTGVSRLYLTLLYTRQHTRNGDHKCHDSVSYMRSIYGRLGLPVGRGQCDITLRYLFILRDFIDYCILYIVYLHPLSLFARAKGKALLVR